MGSEMCIRDRCSRQQAALRAERREQMIPGLEPVPLRELQALGTSRVWNVEGQLEAIQSLTPVRGSLRAEHRGNLLEVEGSLQTIVCLRCDRCLGRFNQELKAESKELIWLGGEPTDELLADAGLDPETPDGLVDVLDPRGDFEPERWVFEQLSLQMSVVNRCCLLYTSDAADE